MGKSLGSLVQISKGYDSYLDERGRGKENELTNIAIYRLLDEMYVNFGIAIICLCKPFRYFVSVIVKFCQFVLGAVLRDRHPFHGNGKVIKTLSIFFSKIGNV